MTDAARRATDPIAAAVAAGYAFEGPALELGGLMLDADRRSPTSTSGSRSAMLNRHGLVAGATGTGKTKTLQLLAEQLSRARRARCSPPTSRATCPALGAPGEDERQDHRARRVASASTWTATGFPVEFYALGGQGTGIPLRVTMTRVRPDPARARCSASTTPRSPRLGLVFHYADQAGLPLLDLADLRAVVQLPDLRRGQGRPQGPRRPVVARPPG